MIDYTLATCTTSYAACEVWAHADRMGSTVMTSDSAGNEADMYMYSEYGASGSEGNSGFPFRFTGQKLDPVTGLYYYKNRWYDPETGRFLSTDPIGYGDGMNMYAAVGNDPVNKADPTGLGIADIARDIERSLGYTDSKGNIISTAKNRDVSYDDFWGGWYNNNPDEFYQEFFEQQGYESFQNIVNRTLYNDPIPADVVTAIIEAQIQVQNRRIQRCSDCTDSIKSADLEFFGPFIPVGGLANFAAKGIASLFGRQSAVGLGLRGEAAVRAAIDIGPKRSISLGTKIRFPDGLTRNVLSEVKNVKSLSFTSQLRDYSFFAQQSGLRFDLYVRPTTSFSRPLAGQFGSGYNGTINLLIIPQ